MSNKPEIEKHRLIHDLKDQFQVPDSMVEELSSQLSEEDQQRMERFSSGFKTEDWFKWIFSEMPWVRLAHGLDQSQAPLDSKLEYQVPDFLVLAEASDKTNKPVLVEVKGVSGKKQTLRVQETQMRLCEAYAASVNLPLVYATYWSMFNCWTANPPQSFERKGKSAKLSVLKAIEGDCSLLFGDMFFLIPRRVTRVSQYDKTCTESDRAVHPKYGALISDTAMLDEKAIQLKPIESAALDAALSWRVASKHQLSNDVTELNECLDEENFPKLSSWVFRLLLQFGQTPSHEITRLAVLSIWHLMRKLGCPELSIFPFGKKEGVEVIEEHFIRNSGSPPHNQPLQRTSR